MNRELKGFLPLTILLVALPVLCFSTPTCVAEDSPKYILSIYPVDPNGSILIPVPAEFAASTNKTMIAIAVTTQIPSGVNVTGSGFAYSTNGTPKPTVTSVSLPTDTVQNANGSKTEKYILEVKALPNSGATMMGFTFYADITVQTNKAPITHMSDPIYFTITGTNAPSLTPSPTAENPTPTVPEYPTAIVTALMIVSACAAVGLKLKQTRQQSKLI